ncbi:hypothetical protein QE412_002630 [Microbacterium trichothecenolyticum]|uniref:Uncharacterized protein n=1 Tax=Microbacterium trichothecenolyticum TaxID=69370 RepID=A0ABU0TWL6_MICTR|nr:hypothetical protein [Microbacterium trichothecenolyticum]
MSAPGPSPPHRVKPWSRVARATAIVMDDPDADFAEAVVEARRLVAQRALPGV